MSNVAIIICTAIIDYNGQWMVMLPGNAAGR